MQDLEKLRREWSQREDLRELAASRDASALRARVDAKALSEALQRGDSAALQRLLAGALSSPEGQRLAKKLIGK